MHARRAQEVALRVFALHRDLDQWRLPGELEHGTEKKGAPDYLAPHALLEILGQLRGDVTVGRRELEVEVDRRPGRHGVGAPSGVCAPGCVSTSFNGSSVVAWPRRRRGFVRRGSSS